LAVRRGQCRSITYAKGVALADAFFVSLALPVPGNTFAIMLGVTVISFAQVLVE
jgi:hypothetical protein